MTSLDENRSRRLAEMLGVRFPLLSAPMAGVSGVDLASAMSRAGGLGILAGGYLQGDDLERAFAEIASQQPFGVGFIVWRLETDPKPLDVALAYKPRAVMLSFGAIDRWAAQIHAQDALVIAQVQTVSQAVAARNAGADIVIAQGGEAGGHCGERGTLALVPAVADAIPNVPLVAAGGIVDGRAMAAALALGAHGALLGTALYASRESMIFEAAKQRAIDASGDDTVRTPAYDQIRQLAWPPQWQLRTLHSALTEAWQRDEREFDANLPQIQERFLDAVSKQNAELAPVIVGEGVGSVRSIEPVSTIIARLVEQTDAILANLPLSLPTNSKVSR